MSTFNFDVIEGRVKTKNNMGYMFANVGGASSLFVEQCKNTKGRALDLGCAYGNVALEVLRYSQNHVDAYDLSIEHLEILQKCAGDSGLSGLSVTHGKFPCEWSYEAECFDSIHSSQMFHFLSGEEIEVGLRKCREALKPSGKIYINTASLYATHFSDFVEEYDSRSRNGDRWPGHIFDFKKFMPDSEHKIMPDFFHVHRPGDFAVILEHNGFFVERLFSYDPVEPKSFASEGKALIGIVASKRIGALSG